MRKFSILTGLIVALLMAEIAGASSRGSTRHTDDSAEATPRPKTRHHQHINSESDDASTPAPKSTPAPSTKPKSTAKNAKQDETTGGTEGKPNPGKATSKSGNFTASPTDEEQPARSTSPKMKPKAALAEDAKEHAIATKDSDAASPESSPNVPAPAKPYYPAAVIETKEITGFEKLPEKVKSLIQAALELTRQNLNYTYGSADPSNGGMDCSGAIYYLLRQQGFADVPRDSSEQYAWARKQGQFYAVISRKPGGFEFSDLLPGDLLFWNGTYSISRDPPVTHVMIYLGVHRGRKQALMWGSSDGRSYEGKQRWGVSVFDFTMPKNDPEKPGPKALFIGYAHIPGLR